MEARASSPVRLGEMQHKYEYRRKLPHYQPDHKAFFITFSSAKRWILPESARDITMEVCVYGNGKRFHLHGLVVMPDHVHLVLTPLADAAGPFPIADIMQTLKSTSAHRINKILGRTGKVWQDESFDRALRNEDSIPDKVDYILGNPVGAGLVRNPLEYRWMSQRLILSKVGACFFDFFLEWISGA